MGIYNFGLGKIMGLRKNDSLIEELGIPFPKPPKIA